MVITNSPALVSSVCISIYWFIVILKVAMIIPKIGKAPNVIPKEPLGLLSRLFMVPLIVFWLYLPWNASFFLEVTYRSLAWIGALLSLSALALTIYCWYYMGNLWRIGIDPKEKNELITDGPFKCVRHPIYALSMLLMLGSFLSVQTVAMFALLCVHWILFQLEAYREERYLGRVHGDSYKKYVQQSSRFISFRCSK